MLLTIAAKPFTWLAEEASVGFEDSFFGFVPSLRCERRVNAQHRSQPCMIFGGDAGISRSHQPADRRRR